MTVRIPPALEHRNIPLCDLRAQSEKKRLVVGVAIASRTSGKLLLLQRAADEEFLPNVYELPGGHAEDDTDATIFDTVVREAAEETGLMVTAVLREFEPFEYGRSVQLNFVVEVEAAEDEVPVPKLNPSEHQAFVWANVDGLDGLPMSEGMGEVVRNAFGAIRGE